MHHNLNINLRISFACYKMIFLFFHPLKFFIFNFFFFSRVKPQHFIKQQREDIRILLKFF